MNECNQEKLIELTCHHCDFYKPEEKEQLKCGAYLLLQRLLQQGVIGLEDLEKQSSR